LMILNHDSPRSLATCTQVVYKTLIELTGAGNHEVVRQAGALMAETRYGRIDDVLEQGMEGWLQRVMTRLFALSTQIDRHFLLKPEVVEQLQEQSQG